MTEDIHKIDRPAFDPIRVRSNQENSGGFQRRRGQAGKPNRFGGSPEDHVPGDQSPDNDDLGNRILDIQV